MKIGDLFPTRYLKARDLDGRSVVVTIERVEQRPVGRSQELCPVVYFAGKQKGLILNKTNAQSIATIARTDETSAWVGVRICLFVTPVEFSGTTGDAIRIKPPAADLRVVSEKA